MIYHKITIHPLVTRKYIYISARRGKNEQSRALGKRYDGCLCTDEITKTTSFPEMFFFLVIAVQIKRRGDGKVQKYVVD